MDAFAVRLEWSELPLLHICYGGACPQSISTECVCPFQRSLGTDENVDQPFTGDVHRPGHRRANGIDWLRNPLPGIGFGKADHRLLSDQRRQQKERDRCSQNRLFHLGFSGQCSYRPAR